MLTVLCPELQFGLLLVACFDRVNFWLCDLYADPTRFVSVNPWICIVVGLGPDS